MWKTIKNLLQNGGQRCIIVENEKPVYVVIRIEDYESLLTINDSKPAGKKRNNPSTADEEKFIEETEEVNKELTAEEGMKVEDLPF